MSIREQRLKKTLILSIIPVSLIISYPELRLINIPITMSRTCLDCGEKIFGRSDKKFCNDQCRNNYNNRLNSNINNYIKNVNNSLRKNRRILQELNPNGKTKVHKDKLVAKGFNFSYFTSLYKTKAGTIYYFCYEQGYLHLEGDFYALVERKEYLE